MTIARGARLSASAVMTTAGRVLLISPPQLGIARIVVGTVGDDLSNDVGGIRRAWSSCSDEVLEREPNRSLAPAVVGHQRKNQSRMAEAQAELEGAIAPDRNDAWAVRTLGHTLMLSAQPEAAIPYLEKTIRLNPRSLV
jgi:adenylate cyclase